MCLTLRRDLLDLPAQPAEEIKIVADPAGSGRRRLAL